MRMPSIAGLASLGAVVILGVAMQSGAASAVTAAPKSSDPTCTGPSAITNVSYTLAHADGTTSTVSTLHGNVRWGDTVTANFAIPANCAGTSYTLAAYISLHPWWQLYAQQLDNYQTSTPVACTTTSLCHLTAKIPAGPNPPANVTILGARSDLPPITAGQTLYVGYQFFQDNFSSTNIVRVTNGKVVVTVPCAGGGTGTLTVSLPAEDYLVDASSAVGGVPPSTGLTPDPAVWQGQTTVPAGFCGTRAAAPGVTATFTAGFNSTAFGTLNRVRFHFTTDRTSPGAWFPSSVAVPFSGPPHWQIDFATGPVVLPPPKYGADFIDASTDAVAPVTP